MDWSNEARHFTYVLLISYKGYRESKGQVQEWLGKSMIEKEEQVHTGLESGALKEDGYIRVDQLMNRICAPKPSQPQPRHHSIILWTKELADDKVKTWDKVVCPTSGSNIAKSENLRQYSLEASFMVWTNWTTNSQLRMLQLKMKWGLCKLALSMPSFHGQLFSFKLALYFRTGSSNPIPRDRIEQGGVMVKATGPQAVFGRPYNAQVRLQIQLF